MSKATTFGQWLKQRRKALGLTQKELAQQVGCAEITLRKIEAGDLQPSAPLVASLARVVGAAEGDLPGLLSLARGADDDFTARARLLRPQRPHNLPAQLTPLIGRTHDITAVRKRLLSDGARLITLLGPPGVGKTRLALAVAEDVLEQFEHGAFFVRLGPVSDPTLVAATIAQALGMEMSGPNPPELQLRAWLEEKHLLLVLDNFEQVVAAAPLVDDLLRRCPWLHVLVTSRQPLRVRGERQMTVHPLALPVAQPGGGRLTADDALRYAAVALFAERAEAVQPDFAVVDGNAAAVAELCRRLDGLPLAIELVAARVKLLPPAELLVRLHGPWLLSADGLRDVSERQRTLRGAIGWSYDLLTPVEQVLFTRLSVFVGGCTLEAAELLCGDALSAPLPLSLSPAQVLDGIASLLDKSLLHRETGLYGQPRYAMLETVREYGLERQTFEGQDVALHARHATCCLQLITKAVQRDPDPGRLLLARLIDDDVHNVRAALVWALERDSQVALLLASVLIRWIGSRGPYTEARRLLAEVFAAPGVSARTPARATALVQAAYLSVKSVQERQAYAAEAMTISRELGDLRGEADALQLLGQIAHHELSDREAARTNLERALELYARLGDYGETAETLALLGESALGQGDLRQARALAEACLEAARRGGFTYAWPLGILANVAWAERNLGTARLLFEEHLAVQRTRGSKGGLVYGLTELGNVATRQGDFAAARDYLNEAMSHAQQLGSDDLLGTCFVLMAALAQAKGDHRHAIWLHRQLLMSVNLEEGIACWAGLCLLNLAAQAETLEQIELAARLLGAVDHADSTILRLYPVERDDYERLVDAVRPHLEPARFDTAWTQGREQRFNQITQEAVSILEAALRVEGRTVSA